MLSRIPLNRVPQLIEEIQKTITSSEISGRVKVALLSPDAGDQVQKAQEASMFHLNRLMDGGRLMAKMRLMYEDALISTGVTNMQFELDAGEAWLKVATKLLAEATSGEAQEVPFFSDANQARSTEISFSALNPDDQDKVERMIQRAEDTVDKVQKKIDSAMQSSNIELEDGDLDTLKSLVPSVRYGFDSAA
ncbi:hypothetical protein [Sulfitobacter sp. R18_1]|uniref:hypothetical protein n=1 Tax=Sulfitobacter sp. R18_1 TaxID=2821104 RepID=UPI001ADCC836|nr:hypothetical protein [Sulfitobacter sp. R18_1]MBO9428495.1 hypothetical protein [Sulfitobacter sp. R18_1]